MIRTSYLANVRKIENEFDYFIYIIRKKPETLKVDDKHIWFSALGPSDWLLKGYKNKMITFQDFTDGYLRELKLYGIDQIDWIVKKHKVGKRICLVCYEKDYNICHRSILSNVIKDIINDNVFEF